MKYKRKSKNRQRLASINRYYDKVLSYVVSKLLEKHELGKIVKKTGLGSEKVEGEEKWVKKWKTLSSRINVKYYRVFSHYIGNNINIIPDDVCRNLVEEILNPQAFKGLIDDKCLFDLFMSTRFKEHVTPTTVIRSIGGIWSDGDFKDINDKEAYIKAIKYDRLLSKPTFDSNSGKGICLFTRNKKDGQFYGSIDGSILTPQLLDEYYGDNFIVQQRLEQSEYINQFCPTSVNTIRVATYKSVKTNEPHILNCIMRIGNNGAIVDNAHAGGCFIGVYPDGKLGKYLCNQYGEKFTVFNNIDFEKNDFIIPDIDKVWDFAKEVTKAIPHMRLFQLDIAIDKDNNPRLIEYNVRAFSPWLYQFTTGPALGDCTDEILQYCIAHKKEATRIDVSF